MILSEPSDTDSNLGRLNSELTSSTAFSNLTSKGSKLKNGAGIFCLLVSSNIPFETNFSSLDDSSKNKINCELCVVFLLFDIKDSLYLTTWFTVMSLFLGSSKWRGIGMYGRYAKLWRFTMLQNLNCLVLSTL
ncbi:hypothetical protein OGATHE_005351 [Ogataea polymorpha]|uniref:Uncharacterized protein n=1 Tax=Ogataea polymorpha TaxID=460523 RepID=A0A9P8NXS6_9ASCO|nr:hypothetical protein OGATHE_005351 [Ogataea polymorpha]